MSTYEELKKEFDMKVEELRKSCKHLKISEWMDFQWASGHPNPTGFQVKVCEICGAHVAERTTCWSCEKWIEKPYPVEGDGRKTPLGMIFCSQKCADKEEKRYIDKIKDLTHP